MRGRLSIGLGHLGCSGSLDLIAILGGVEKTGYTGKHCFDNEVNRSDKTAAARSNQSLDTVAGTDGCLHTDQMVVYLGRSGSSVSIALGYLDLVFVLRLDCFL